MINIVRNDTDPFFNIAAEEYIFKNIPEDIFMVWNNEEVVVVGKHQNAFSEIDQKYVKENNIPVIRRITGGGTVFHDDGNLNYSLIFHKNKNAQIDYQRNTNAIIEALKGLGLNAALQDKSNITVDGIKVSGNSEHLFKNRILHHGTLLFSSDINRLEKIKGNKLDSYSDKAVKSIRKEVVNISDILEKKMSFNEFSDYIRNFLTEYYKPSKSISLNSQDKAEINKLIEGKYSKWDWNYAYSPNFEISKSIEYLNSVHHFTFKIKSGHIIKTEYSGNAHSIQGKLEKLEKIAFKPDLIEKKLISLNFGEQLPKSLVNSLIYELF